MKIITTSKAPEAIGPYSQAIIVNGLLYTSGQIPIIPGRNVMVDGGIKKQTRQVIENIIEILKEANVSLENVIKTTCYLKNMKDFSQFNEVYGEYFTVKPVRSCVAVSELPKDSLVEIDVIAEIK